MNGQIDFFYLIFLATNLRVITVYPIIEIISLSKLNKR